MSSPVPLTDKELALLSKYEQEREKRLAETVTSSQYTDTTAEGFRELGEDLYVDHDLMNSQEPALRDGDSCKILILGTGHSGLLFAARLIDAGFSPDDIRLVDDAGGFGGTWYWNRYPGLMCDVESYIYMPLLEETGYVPKHKYAYGPEIQGHCERIAAHWNINNKTLFRTTTLDQVWDDSRKEWKVKMVENRGPGQEKRELEVRSQYVISARGIFTTPHLPNVPGIRYFKGKIFHTARWDYAYTGGSPEDQSLVNLKDKSVAVVGTGATTVQVIPELAKWAKHVYVVQRTPSAVGIRGQRLNDKEAWPKEVATGPGWQKARSENYNSFFLCNPKDKDLVNDGWTHSPSFGGLIGATFKGIVTPDKIPQHITDLQKLDLQRAEDVRSLADKLVKDPAVAQKLKAWYPGWCKRPTFHDDYLPSFNRENVTLIDTDGKGIEKVTENGIVAAGRELQVDLLVLGTGFTTSQGVAKTGTMKIWGKNGVDLREKWDKEGVASLHGVATNGFPNYFFSNGRQATASSNLTYTYDTVARHVAWIMSRAELQSAPETSMRKNHVVIEATKESEEAWALEVVKRAGFYAAVPTCTPSYWFNPEARKHQEPKDQLKAARQAQWGEGPNSYAEVLEAWRNQNGLQGIVVE